MPKSKSPGPVTDESLVFKAKLYIKGHGSQVLVSRTSLARHLGVSSERLNRILGRVIQDGNYHRQGENYFYQE